MLQKFYDREKYCYGFQDENGTIVIPAVYDKAEDFEYGVAVVQPDDSDFWGLIDERRNTLIPFVYEDIFVWHNRWVQAQMQNEHFLFTIRGELLLQVNDILYWDYPHEEVIRVKKKTGWGAIGMKGDILIDFKYKSLGPCTNGWLSYYENGRWGWLTKIGDIAVGASFDEVGVLDKNRWWGKSGKVCLIYDYMGQELGTEEWKIILNAIR